MASSFVVELWTGYVVGMGAFFLRFYARWKTVGFKKFAVDDFFCFLGMVFFTFDAGLTYIYGTKGSSVGLTPETALKLDPETVKAFTIGSRALFFAWICYITFTWTLKAVLLGLYSRLTLGLWQHKLARFMWVWCFLAWSVCIIFHFAVCTPPQRAWQVVPYPGDSCVLRKPNHTLVGALNIASDIGIIAIPLPLLFTARLPLARKIVLGLLFCSGIFVIVTVILRLVFSLGDINSLPTAGSWALRETFASVITVTAPGIKPLFNRNKWINSSLQGYQSDKATGACNSGFNTHSSAGGNFTSVTAYEDGAAGQGTGRQNYELSSIPWPKKGAKKTGRPYQSDSGSQEHIVPAKEEDNAIHVVTEYRLEHEGSDGSRV